MTARDVSAMLTIGFGWDTTVRSTALVEIGESFHATLTNPRLRSVIARLSGIAVRRQSGARAAPIVDFRLPTTDPGVGELFSIDVRVDGVDLLDEIIAFGFDIDFDASWSLISTVVGTAFNDDSGLLPNTGVAGSVFPGPGPNGDDILLATLSLTGSIPGTFSFAAISDLLDLNEGLYTFNSFDPYDLSSSTDVTNKSTLAVPTPGTVALVLAGVLGLFGSARVHRTML